MANLLPRAERFIRDKLLAASVASSRIYSQSAPSDAAEPYVIVQIQSPGTDEQTLNQNRIWSDPLFIVKAVASTHSWNSIQAVADAIDTALHHTSGSTSGARVINCRRVRDFGMEEGEGDDTHRHLGGYFRVLIQEA